MLIRNCTCYRFLFPQTMPLFHCSSQMDKASVFNPEPTRVSNLKILYALNKYKMQNGALAD